MESKENNVERLNSLVKTDDTQITKIIDENINNTSNIKEALDMFATATAVKQEETVVKIVEEKQEELKNDAEAKRVKAETDRIQKEVEKVKQEKEKELAILDKIISSKQKEVEQLRVEGDKAQAFFDSNKEILSYVGVRSKKTLKIMYFLMIPAVTIFGIIQFLALPFTICGKLMEIIIEIVGGVCKAISNNALKIIISIVVILILVTGGFLSYFYGGRFLSGIK